MWKFCNFGIMAGRPRNIESPDKLHEYFLKYIEETKAKPFLIKDWVGKDAFQVEREKERPLTMEGFECWLFDNSIISDLSHYFSNRNGAYTEFVAICSHIKRVIRKDQIEGGMAGQYNPSITQRLNNLVEKTEDVTPQAPKKLIIKVNRRKDEDS